MILAICQLSGVVLEAAQNPTIFSALDPQPYLSKIFVKGSSTASDKFFDAALPDSIIFREDLFDPTTRIRRGRIYKKFQKETSGGLIVNFGRFAWPYGGRLPLPNSGHVGDGGFIFFRNILDFALEKPIRSILSLGDQNHVAAWRIVGAERLFNGETLFTLKAASTLGTLPELIEEELPEEKKKEIQEGFEKVVDVAPVQIAESVVDVCREFARLLLAAWLPTVGVAVAAVDLGRLVSKVPEDRKGIANAASVITRLHSRGKSSERERQAGRGQEIRPLADEDASLAVSLIGFLLRDFGWAA